jgi:hypothetical protein
LFYFLSLPPLSLSLSLSLSPITPPRRWVHLNSTPNQLSAKTTTPIISKIDQTQIHKSMEMGKQRLQNHPQQISWVCLKSNKRFTHTHTAGCSQHSQCTHTTEITNATIGNTPNRPTKEKSTKKTLSIAGSRRKLPLEVAGNRLCKSSKITLQPLDDDPQENRHLY